ncbi:MAG: DoxX family protein [Betaproteobacteria bacterium]|nr:DoxX family protein [Betaproteobacteria bacterium]
MERLCEAAKRYGPLAGRILMALIFLKSGFGKVTNFAGTAGYMASKGMPMAEVLLVGAIVLELAGAIMLVIGWKARWGALLLIVFMIPATLVFHDFWAADAAHYGNQLNHFMKNVAMIGGLLYVMAFGAGPLALDKAKVKE